MGTCVRFRQINVNRCQKALDTALEAARREQIDLLLLSKQTPAGQRKGGRWLEDLSKNAAIVIPTHSLISIDKVDTTAQGYVWMNTAGLRIYSCCVWPNADQQTFSNTLAAIETSLQGWQGEVLLTGDFHAKSWVWGSSQNNERGAALLEVMARHNWTIPNRAACTREISGMVLHLTLATPEIASTIKDWRMSREEDLFVNHSAITFSIDAGKVRTTEERNEPRRMQWNSDKPPNAKTQGTSRAWRRGNKCRCAQRKAHKDACWLQRKRRRQEQEPGQLIHAQAATEPNLSRADICCHKDGHLAWDSRSNSRAGPSTSFS